MCLLWGDEDADPHPRPTSQHFWAAFLGNHGRRAPRSCISQKQGSLCSRQDPHVEFCKPLPGATLCLVVRGPGDAKEGKPQSLLARIGGIHAYDEPTCVRTWRTVPRCV